jgi:hypothetical protein
MMHYLIGGRALALVLAVVVSAALSLLFSFVLTWASKRSPLWNMGFAIAVALLGTLAFLALVILVLRRVSLE